MASINLQGDTSGSISIQAPSVAGSNTITLPATTQTLATQNALGVRNRIINGDMRIDQRNAGASVTPGNGVYTIDRWAANQFSPTGKFSVQQNAGSVTPPQGFTHYLGVTSSSAYSVSTNDVYGIYHFIEGYNIANLNWGTANAKTITLSFWVRSSLTGTFAASIRNGVANRSYPFTYTISSADTWEQKSVTISGDITGTWATNHTAGLLLHFSLGTGTGLNGTANSWQAGNYASVSGATSVVGTNGATFYITGVQLEVGDTATPFEHRPYDMELARCQRYFQKVSGGINGGPYQIMSILTYEASHTAWGTVPLRVSMRSQPTITYSGSFTTNYGTAGTAISDTNQVGGDVAVIGWTGGSGGVVGYSTYYRANNSTSAFISFSSEL